MIPNESEYLAFDTKKWKMLGKTTKRMYLPLIDTKPLDPSTMMTAAIKAMKLTEWAGKAHILVTCNQQLYKFS